MIAWITFLAGMHERAAAQAIRDGAAYQTRQRAENASIATTLQKQLSSTTQIALFAGPGSATADMVGLGQAMTAERDQRRNTGPWHRGPTGAWEYEIDDKKAVVRDVQPGVHKLGEVLDHPALYEAYPLLRDRPVTYSRPGFFDDPRPTGYRSPDGLWITSPPGMPMRKTVFHEVQHELDAGEGSPRGLGQLRSQSPNDWDRYFRDPAEAHARAAAARSEMDATQRATTPTEQSYDVPWRDLIR